MIMDTIDDFRLRRKRDLFPVFSSLALTLVLAGVLSVAFFNYRNRMQDIVLSENRYLTAEWRLLQELKAQTDAELREKDKQILELNNRYLSLVRSHASASDLGKIEDQLQQVKRERQEIEARRLNPASTGTIVFENALLRGPQSADSQSPLTGILQKDLETSRKEIENKAVRIEALGKEIMDLDAKIAARSRGSDQALSEYRSRIEILAASLKERGTEQAGNAQLPLEDLKTWALVRALVSSPEIRAKYPNLLDALDRYLSAYGAVERLKGRREAFSTAAAELQPLTR